MGKKSIGILITTSQKRQLAWIRGEIDRIYMAAIEGQYSDVDALLHPDFATLQKRIDELMQEIDAAPRKQHPWQSGRAVRPEEAESRSVEQTHKRVVRERR